METKQYQDPLEGLRNNWVFIGAAVGLGMWLNNNLSDIHTINTTQTDDIADNRERIEQLEKAFDDNRDTNVEIIRRLDAVAKDIELIKTQK